MSNKKSKVEELLERAFYFQGKRRFDKSSELFRKILSIEPEQPDALYALGIIAYEGGQREAAVQLIVQSLRANSNNVPALNSLAGILKEQRQFADAAEIYQAALAIAPNDAYLHSNLGVVFMEMRQMNAAIACLNRSLELDPQAYAAHCNLGSIFQGQGQLQMAMDCYMRALALRPKEPVVLSNIGSILNERGLYSEAVRYFELAIQIAPKSEVAHSNLGAALQRLGRVPEAIASCWRALEINPRSYNALNNLGNALRRQREFAQATACLKKAQELNPDCYLAHFNLGTVLSSQGLLDESLVCFHKALELAPELMTVHRYLGATLYLKGDSEESVKLLRKALAMQPDCADAFSDLLFVLNHLRQMTPEELFAEHLRFGERFNGLLEPIPHSNSPEPERRLRVGFVSGDLREHPVSNFIGPVFNTYDRSQFEVYCYENHPVNDAVSERLKAQVDAWFNVDLLSDAELARQIRSDGIDILVDLSGHTTLNRLLVFARKPAPVQVTMIGYIQTTGLAAIDYRITDSSLDPVGATEHLSTEKLIRLPAGAAPFLPPPDCPPVNELPALKNGYVTFGSFNKQSKVTPEAFAAWARILHAVPGSKLLMIGASCDAIADTMASHGIGPERLELFKSMPMPDYLKLHHRVDLYLDTFPYNGGTTSLIASWMGLPFVTVEGPSPLSRCGAALLNAVGLSELIAATADEYAQKAVAAVQDLPRLAEWRAMLRPCREPQVGDGSGFTRQLETAFREMWKEWAGKKG